MYLPEDCPNAFAIFVDWVYRAALSVLKTAKKEHVVAHVRTLYELYIFAEKLCMNELKNKVMDIQDNSLEAGFLMDGALCPKVHENSPEGSTLRTFCLRAMVYKAFDQQQDRPGVSYVLGPAILDEIHPIVTGYPTFYRSFFSAVEIWLTSLYLPATGVYAVR